VNRVALAGAVAAMKDEAYLQSTLKALIYERGRLAEGLQNLGFEVFPSQANFLTVKTSRQASELASHLEKHGLLVQSMPWPDSFGSLRMTIGNAHDVDQLLQHLGEFLNR
jgi:histidinol-phosphate aminotransferase